MSPTFEHELIVELLRDAEVVRFLLGVAGVSIGGHAGVVDATLTAPEQRADLVILFGSQAAPQLAVVVEVQRNVDEHKRLSWPHYETSARVRHGCEACVLVFATTDAVASWAARPVRLGPVNTFRAIVLDARSVPAITEPADALALPSLSVLSAIVHGHDSAAVASARAAIEAVRTLHPAVAALYFDAILDAMDETARAQLEASMNLIKGYEYQSDFAKKYFGEGHARGRIEGELDAARAAVLDVLTARGLNIQTTLRERIESCDDLPTLRKWIARAAVAGAAEDILE